MWHRHAQSFFVGVLFCVALSSAQLELYRGAPMLRKNGEGSDNKKMVFQNHKVHMSPVERLHIGSGVSAKRPEIVTRKKPTVPAASADGSTNGHPHCTGNGVCTAPGVCFVMENHETALHHPPECHCTVPQSYCPRSAFKDKRFGVQCHCNTRRKGSTVLL